MGCVYLSRGDKTHYLEARFRLKVDYVRISLANVNGSSSILITALELVEFDVDLFTGLVGIVDFVDSLIPHCGQIAVLIIANHSAS